MKWVRALWIIPRGKWKEKTPSSLLPWFYFWIHRITGQERPFLWLDLWPFTLRVRDHMRPSYQLSCIGQPTPQGGEQIISFVGAEELSWASLAPKMVMVPPSYWGQVGPLCFALLGDWILSSRPAFFQTALTTCFWPHYLPQSHSRGLDGYWHAWLRGQDSALSPSRLLNRDKKDLTFAPMTSSEAAASTSLLVLWVMLVTTWNDTSASPNITYPGHFPH